MNRTAVAANFVHDIGAGALGRELLGGKGANLAEMTRILGAGRVPAGFTITTEACLAFMRDGRREPDALAEQVDGALERLERTAGKRLGDADDPLLVSVRSGARESMPGMLDTILNLGLSDLSVEGLAARTANPRFAWDCYRRFVQMFGSVVSGIPGASFEQEIASCKAERGVALDTELDTDELRELTNRFKALYLTHIDAPFPQDPRAQLERAIRAVFDSWLGERAVAYRRLNHIPDGWGTAVTVQQMVFGNKGETSGSGVAFSRDELSGAPVPSGEFLANAQGEDVVSGLRNTSDLAALAELMPRVSGELHEILSELEAHYRDMQDVEFTVEEGRLYILQTRNAKRPAQAAVRFAVDAVAEGMLDRAEAISTIDPSRLDALMHPTFDPAFVFDELARGVGASPGAAKGEIVFSADAAVRAARAGRASILVRPFTEAEDITGFAAARGILTSEGGKASHAALLARGMGRPCVCGASALEVDLEAQTVRVGDRLISAGTMIAIDGTTGAVTLDDVPMAEAQPSEQFRQLLSWCDELRRLGVRANADTREDALRARSFGAEGIGLCRTEHMFIGAERQPKMRTMILAADAPARRGALSELQPMQQQDFEELFEAMTGLPVTIRLLDPPLHEFLPNQAEAQLALEHARAEDSPEVPLLERKLEVLASLIEVNPMLGTRGCRLGILYPEIYEMQVAAIALAAVAVRERTHAVPQLEIMIPLVDYEQELALMRDLVVRVAGEHGLREREDFAVGTMIELPRACLVADRIAEHADFFSFGTNDLTQTALGFSRDDVESKFIPVYLEHRIIDRSPFETLDIPGVGRLIELAAEHARGTKPALKLGVCGEHGGEPDSIEFFERLGIDYVSCSPFRVPIARVAAAQSAIRARGR